MAFEDLTDAELGDYLREKRSHIDAEEKDFSLAAAAFARRGCHLLDGHVSAVSWLRANCKLSSTSAADRVCVGKELESIPALAAAVETGEIGFQSAAAVCHLLEQVGEKRAELDHEALLEWTTRMGVNEVRNLCRHLRYVVDPQGAERADEFDFERRNLKIS